MIVMPKLIDSESNDPLSESSSDKSETCIPPQDLDITLQSQMFH